MGGIVFNKGISVIVEGSGPDWIPTSTQSRFARERDTARIWYYDDTKWNLIDLGALTNANSDGNHSTLPRENEIATVEPTAVEVPNPENGDTAAVYLNNGNVEHYVFTTIWNLAYTQSPSESESTTVSNSDSISLTLTGEDISATLNLDASQDDLYQLTISSDGIKLTKKTLKAYASYALANADVNSGEYYLLTVNNLEGVPSDGSSFPIVRKP